MKRLENLLTSVRVVSQTDGHLVPCSVTPHNFIVTLNLGRRKPEVQQIDGGIVKVADGLSPADANALKQFAKILKLIGCTVVCWIGDMRSKDLGVLEKRHLEEQYEGTQIFDFVLYVCTG